MFQWRIIFFCYLVGACPVFASDKTVADSLDFNTAVQGFLPALTESKYFRDLSYNDELLEAIDKLRKADSTEAEKLRTEITNVFKLYLRTRGARVSTPFFLENSQPLQIDEKNMHDFEPDLIARLINEELSLSSLRNFAHPHSPAFSREDQQEYYRKLVSVHFTNRVEVSPDQQVKSLPNHLTWQNLTKVDLQMPTKDLGWAMTKTYSLLTLPSGKQLTALFKWIPTRNFKSDVEFANPLTMRLDGVVTVFFIRGKDKNELNAAFKEVNDAWLNYAGKTAKPLSAQISRLNEKASKRPIYSKFLPSQDGDWLLRVYTPLPWGPRFRSFAQFLDQSLKYATVKESAQEVMHNAEVLNVAEEPKSLKATKKAPESPWAIATEREIQEILISLPPTGRNRSALFLLNYKFALRSIPVLLGVTKNSENTYILTIRTDTNQDMDIQIIINKVKKLLAGIPKQEDLFDSTQSRKTSASATHLHEGLEKMKRKATGKEKHILDVFLAPVRCQQADSIALSASAIATVLNNFAEGNQLKFYPSQISEFFTKMASAPPDCATITKAGRKRKGKSEKI